MPTSAWESRDWNDTQPEERVIQLSPAECSILEAVAHGRRVTIIPAEAGGKPVVFGPDARYGYLDGDMPDAHRIDYATFNGERVESEDLIAADDTNGWLVYWYGSADGFGNLGLRKGGDVRFIWKPE